MAFRRRTGSKGTQATPPAAKVDRSHIETFIDEHSILSGELRFGEDVRIEGRVEGQIRGEKRVVVGPGAEIDATIDADTLEVHGTVVGDIRVARGTTLHKTARVEGEIQTAGIVVEEGARFKGCIVIGPEEEPASIGAQDAGSEPIQIGIPTQSAKNG